MASGVMTIRYTDQSMISGAGKAADLLGGIAGSLTGVGRKISSLVERSRWGDNLSRASAFLCQKERQYDAAGSALDAFARAGSAFMGKVATVEKQISASLKGQAGSRSVMRGISGSRIAAFFSGLADGVKDFGALISGMVTGAFSSVRDKINGFVRGVADAVRGVYENAKEVGDYFIRFAFSAAWTAASFALCTISFSLLCLSALSPAIIIGVLGMTASIIMLADSVMKTAKAGEAFLASITGHIERARELTKMSTADYLAVSGLINDPLTYELMMYATSVMSMFSGLLAPVFNFDPLTALGLDKLGQGLMQAVQKVMTGLGALLGFGEAQEGGDLLGGLLSLLDGLLNL